MFNLLNKNNKQQINRLEETKKCISKIKLKDNGCNIDTMVKILKDNNINIKFDLKKEFL